VASYVCMIYGKDDKVLTVETFKRENDEATMAESEAIATSCAGCRGYELWSSGHKVASNLPRHGAPSQYERFANR